MALLGMFVGGLILVFLVAIAWERLLFSRVFDDPVKGKLASALAAWLTSGSLAGFGMADGGPFAWRAFLIYLVPAIVVTGLGYRRGIQIRQEIEVGADSASVEEASIDLGSESYYEDNRDGHYLVRHWRGDLSLPVSYWLNGTILVGVTVVVLTLAVAWLGSAGFSLRAIAVASLLYLAATLLLWVWAAVGIWRSSDRHADRGGTPGWATVAKVMVVLGVLATVGQTRNYVLQVREFGSLATGTDPLGDPAEITVLPDGGSIALTGIITAGTAARFESILAGNPGVHSLVLSSQGGRMLEAERMAEAILARRISTRVEDVCESACTFVLIAGRERTAALGARIGFHQPSFPGNTPEDHALGVQQTRADYERAGITGEFAARALEARPEQMWYPTYDELLAANVLTSTEFVIQAPTEELAAARQAMLAGEVRNAAYEINQQGTVAIDEVTSLTGAAAAGTTLTYQYVLHAEKRDIDVPVLRRELQKTLPSNVCGNEVMAEAISRGVSYTYSYADQSGREVTSVSVSSCP